MLVSWYCVCRCHTVQYRSEDSGAQPCALSWSTKQGLAYSGPCDLLTSMCWASEYIYWQVNKVRLYVDVIKADVATRVLQVQHSCAIRRGAQACRSTRPRGAILCWVL